MKFRTPAFLGATLLLLAALPAQAQSAFDRAMEQYADSHWREAYSLLSGLADAGHAEAARVALLMRRHGAALYQTSFSATPVQVERWLVTASRALPPGTAAERR